MNRLAIILCIAVLSAGIGWGAYRAESTAEISLSRYVPAGPLLYIEAQDFASLLGDWNSSSEKRQWIQSSNYEVFSRSRLFLRLKGAGDQFAVAAGLPPDMDFLSQVAGDRSALALYDIGNLQFLYITHLPSAKSVQTTLWQSRAKFEPRNAGGADFYLRRDSESKREVAFAVSGDYLLLATREDLLAGALQLISGSQDRTVEAEPWWSQSTASAAKPGDLRMVLNLEKLVPNGYFRTYWVQQNITDLSQYSAVVTDLFRSGREYREQRVLIRKKELERVAATEGAAAAGDVVRLVPADVGLYAATANPSSEQCFALLETKLLAPHLGAAPPSQMAPQVQLTSGEQGGASDLETRIDQPPVAHSAQESTPALNQLLDKAQVQAALEVQSTAREKAGVFVRMHTAVVLVSASDWNEKEVQSALTNFLEPALTASQLGLGWRQNSGYSELDGLWPLFVSAHGKYLLVSGDAALMESMLANFARSSNHKPADFLAGFNHQHERANFARFTNLIDRPSGAVSQIGSMEREPQFFSENMASLSRTIAAVAAERVEVHSEAGLVRETVTYEWSE